MKKYLMTGIAALALCAGFTSCSHDLDAPSPEQVKQNEAKKVVNNYNQAFLNYVGGTISPNQDWGFGVSSTTRTRALSDMTAGANKERNLWAATDNIYKLLVPTPLTKGQRLRVQAYFQAHPNLTWEAPSMTNYFIQQVYKGAEATSGANSREVYPQGNGQEVVGSNHMDQLTVGANSEHVKDFNFGDNPNTAKDVKDNGTLTNDDAYHSDQITLMIGVQPTCVGYESTDGTIKRNDCMALAGAKDIDDWAIKNKATLEEAGLFGEDVWYGTDQYGYLNSSWNRSFVGLDYEQKTLDECYAVDYSSGSPVSPSYVTLDQTYRDYFYLGKDDDNNDIIKSKAQYLQDYPDGYLRDLNGNKIVWVTDQTNQICGTNVDFPNQESYMPRMDCGVAGGGNNEQVLDMTAIQGKLDQNAYPALNGGLLKWIKDIGGRDYVYSDWIVTLTPAQELNIDDPNSIRVMAEDLNATGSDDTDFDFNDIVFDVFFDKENTGKTNVLIKAAGGTLNLRIALVQNPSDTNDEDWAEVHDLFSEFNDGLDCAGKMINTNGTKSANANVRNRSLDGLLEPALELPWSITTPAGAKDIKIQVYKNDSWITIDATKGGPAAKFGCKTSYHWMNERVSIKTEVQSFADWCAGKSDLYWPE